MDERERKVRNTISKCLIFCRKRPVNERERKESDYDVVSCINETTIVVHFPRIHYNGVTKSIEHAPFQFNRVFNQLDLMSLSFSTTNQSKKWWSRARLDPVLNIAGQ